MSDVIEMIDAVRPSLLVCMVLVWRKECLTEGWVFLYGND